MNAILIASLMTIGYHQPNYQVQNPGNNTLPTGFNTVQPTNLFGSVHGRTGGNPTTGNNWARSGQSTPYTVGSPPGGMNSGSIRVGTQVSPSNRRPVVNGMRFGYVHYRRDWQDSWFAYPQYVYYPNQMSGQFPSPWYSYFSLPPYIYGPQITYINPPFLDWTVRYQYGQLRDLDDAVESIILSFQYGRRRDIESLIPRRGLVGVGFNGAYQYSIPADDFMDLYSDGIVNSRTTGYRITQVWMSGDYAQVAATHFYIDPWGRQRQARHVYVLEQDRRDYVIREFSVGAF